MLFVFVALLLVAVPLVSACAPTGPTTGPITLKYHSSEQKGVGSIEPTVWWCEQVEQRSGGRIKFDYVYGGALGTLADQPVNIKGGVFDCGMLTCIYNPGLYPAATVNTLPFVTGNLKAITSASMDLEQDPAIQAEYQKLNMKNMFVYLSDPMEIMSHVSAKNLAELKPLKIRAHGGAAEAFDAAGLTGVAIPWPDLPSAAERHVVDAACIPVPGTAADLNFHEIFKYSIRIPVFYFHYSMPINLDTWNKLPADIQKLMLDVGKEANQQSLKIIDRIGAESWKKFDAAGVVQIQWSADELKKFKDLGGPPVWDKWVKDVTAQGVPGKQVLDTFQKLLAKYGG